MEDQKTRSGMLRREQAKKQPEAAATDYKAIEIRTAKDYNPAQEALLRYAGAAQRKSKFTIRKEGMLTEAERAEKRRRLLIFAGRKLSGN